MSDELLEFNCPNTSDDRGNAKQLHIGSFWGGDKGKCIRITIGDRFVQLTQAEFLALSIKCIAIHSQVYARTAE